MKKIFTIAAAVAAIFVSGVSAAGSTPKYKGMTLKPPQAGAVRVIVHVFGPRYAAQALAVAWCESRFWVWAHNGQYRGLFQMGSWERSRYGHAENNAWIQARAAHRYFVHSGRDWSPWACKP